MHLCRRSFQRKTELGGLPIGSNRSGADDQNGDGDEVHTSAIQSFKNNSPVGLLDLLWPRVIRPSTLGFFPCPRVWFGRSRIGLHKAMA